MSPDERAEICEAIRAHHRRRVFAMDQRKRADLSVGAFLRVALGWRKDGAASDRKAAADAAANILDTAEWALKLSCPVKFDQLGEIAYASLMARRPFAEIEAAATREMGRLAQQLPVWAAFGASTPGFGAVSLAVIIGEAGDLSAYPSEAKLWRRMGVAVIGAGDGLDDHRQGRPGPGASAEDWMAEGYNPRRRSKMFVIGDTLIKTQGPYRDIYLARKAYEIARAADLGLTVCPSAKIPKKGAALYRSDGHVHRRAQRYMEKRLLRHLWRAWRRVDQRPPVPMDHRNAVPCAEIREHVERADA